MNLCSARCPVTNALFLKHFLHLERVPPTYSLLVSCCELGHLRVSVWTCALSPAKFWSNLRIPHSSGLFVVCFSFLLCFESGSFYTALAVLDLTV